MRWCSRTLRGRCSGDWLAALEAQVVEVPLAASENSYAYDVDALLAAVSDRTKMIVLCSPNNPTGNSMAADDVRRCAEAGPMLLLDAAYADFDPEVDLSPLVYEYRNVILSRTFSKAYCLAGRPGAWLLSVQTDAGAARCSRLVSRGGFLTRRRRPRPLGPIRLFAKAHVA